MSYNGNGEGKVKKSRKILYTIVIAVLIVGFIFGNLFSGAVNMAGWFGNDEPEPGPETADEIVGESGFEEARPQLEQQLRQEKEQEIIMQHLEDLREGASVEKNLDVIGEGDENAVVAKVNNEEIKKHELLQVEEQEKQQLMMMGMDPESAEAEQFMEEMRPQILDNLIANVLLMQKVEEQGVSVSEEEVEEQYQYYAEQFEGEEMLEQQLEQAGMTKDEFKQEIAEQLPLQTYVENYIEENLDEDDLDFSEEELREIYEAQMQQQQMQPQQEIEPPQE